MEEEEYKHILGAIEVALGICENSPTADDVVRWRLRQELRELRLGLLSLLAQTQEGGLTSPPTRDA